MLTIIKRLIIIILTVVLLSCVGYPVSEKRSEFEISGKVDGIESSHNEKIIRVTIKHGTQYLFTPEGPIRKMQDGQTIKYYLEKESKRKSLMFLDSSDSDSPWNSIININKKWFAFNVNSDPEVIKIIQFNSAGSVKEYNIQAYHTGTIAEIYIDKSANFIVWKQGSNGYQQYSLKSRKKLKQPTLLPSDLTEYIEIGYIQPLYDSVSFYEVLKSDDVLYKSRYAVETARSYTPLLVTETDSVKLLRHASIRKWYMYRWAVVLNPVAPYDLIEKLTGDPSLYVAEEAKKRFKTMEEEPSDF